MDPAIKSIYADVYRFHERFNGAQVDWERFIDAQTELCEKYGESQFYRDLMLAVTKECGPHGAT